VPLRAAKFLAKKRRTTMNSLVKRHNQLFQDFFPVSIGLDSMFNRLTSLSQSGDNFPPYNIIREGEKTFVEMALAGYSKDDLDVVIKDGVLSIEGTGHSERAGDDDSHVHKGIASRRFTRQFTLGEHVEVNSASMENGMLTVELEVILPPEKQPKHIEIN